MYWTLSSVEVGGTVGLALVEVLLYLLNVLPVALLLHREKALQGNSVAELLYADINKYNDIIFGKWALGGECAALVFAYFSALGLRRLLMMWLSAPLKFGFGPTFLFNAGTAVDPLMLIPLPFVIGLVFF